MYRYNMYRYNIFTFVTGIAAVFGLVMAGWATSGLAEDGLAENQPRLGIDVTEEYVRVTVDGEHFTDYVIRGQPKPILYPLHGPHGLPMTRNYPMRRVEGEATDHPHQQSVWFTHESVNGVSFWHTAEGAGRILHDEVLYTEVEGPRAVIAARNRWVGPDDRVHLTDVTRLVFTVTDRGRIIDYNVTLQATEGEVVFGDVKDALMGVRMHPNLRLRPDPSRGVPEVFGQAVNSEGVTGPDVRPKSARWIAYWGPIDDREVTFAMFDHPSNLRYPTRWHARDYGLLSANPFGIHAFNASDDPQAGAVTLAEGEQMTLRYRILLLDGPADTEELEGMHEEYAAQQPINALYMTGGGFHDFVTQERLITEGLSARLNINWTVDREPGTEPNFVPSRYEDQNWTDGFDLVVHNHSISRSPDEQRRWVAERITRGHGESGVPAVLIHGTMHFSRELDLWHDFTGVASPGHEGRRSAEIRNVASDHPIMRDFGSSWTPEVVEVYIVDDVRPGVTPLAEVYGEETERWHVCYWTHRFGEARVFGTTIGHENATVADPIFLNSLARGVLWATERATVPTLFPDIAR